MEAIGHVGRHPVIEECRLDLYIANEGARLEIADACKEVLDSLTEEGGERGEQVETVLRFINVLWKKYDCQDIAEIYKRFEKVEESLYALVRDEEANQRYRDHFVHLFNVFILGLRIISPLHAELGVERMQETFKIKDEKLKEHGLPFDRDYNYIERLFYIWTLIATFHDIAVPFNYFDDIRRGINKFTEQFGRELHELDVDSSPFDSGNFYAYSTMISALYGNGIVLENNVDYLRANGPNQYLVKTLGREYDRNNHGVLSGFFMWKTIESIFLISKSEKYELNIDQFNVYTEHVLEQDIARAALAISLHSLDPTLGQPSIYPVHFDQFPLTFILLLADGLQEYSRREGTTVRNEMVFTAQPRMDVKVIDGVPSVTAYFAVNEERKDELIGKARGILAFNKIEDDAKDLIKAVSIIGEEIVTQLEKRIFIEAASFDFDFQIFVDGIEEPVFRYKKDATNGQ